MRAKQIRLMRIQANERIGQGLMTLKELNRIEKIERFNKAR